MKNETHLNHAEERLPAGESFEEIESEILDEEKKSRAELLEEEFEKLPCTIKLFPSDANFFLVKVTDAVKIYNYLVGEGIIVRNRHSVSLCCNCLRVTVGTRIENNTLLAALRKYEG